MQRDEPKAPRAPESPIERLIVTAFRLGILERVEDLYDWTVEDLQAEVIERVTKLQQQAAAQPTKPLHEPA